MPRLIVFVCLLVGFASAQNSGPGKGVNFYSIEKEAALGKQLAAEMQQHAAIVHDSVLDGYVAQLGSALAKVADSPFPFTFTIYEDRRDGQAGRFGDAVMPHGEFGPSATEPSVFPGGYIFVPMSLLAEAPSESVLVFQLAHGMAHVALRHGTRMATKDELLQISAIAAQNTGANMTELNSQMMPLAQMALLRTAEREADYLAVQIAAKAGYNAEPAAVWLSQRARPEVKAFSTHPTPESRAAAIRNEIGQLSLTGPFTADTGSFAAAKAAASAIR